MSHVNIVHGFAFDLKLDYSSLLYLYKCFTLVHLSVFDFASRDLALVRFTLKKGTGVPGNYVLTCINKS